MRQTQRKNDIQESGQSSKKAAQNRMKCRTPEKARIAPAQSCATSLLLALLALVAVTAATVA